MTYFLQTYMPLGIMISHALWVFLLVAGIFHKSWGRSIVEKVGRQSLRLAFLVALLSVAGSLFYSEIVGFPPCVLCWWQRAFIYPQAIIFGVALWRKKSEAFVYAVPLSVLSALISLYHQYVYMGGESLLPCTALGGACSKIYVLAYGYITIPMMSLTAALFILLFAWYHRTYLSGSEK